MMIEVTCQYEKCKASFRVSRLIVKNGGGKFCSNRCGELAKLSREITRVCICGCGKTFKVDPEEEMKSGNVREYYELLCTIKDMVKKRKTRGFNKPKLQSSEVESKCVESIEKDELEETELKNTNEVMTDLEKDESSIDEEIKLDTIEIEKEDEVVDLEPITWKPRENTVVREMEGVLDDFACVFDKEESVAPSYWEHHGSF